jgi:subtilisin family serine protease
VADPVPGGGFAWWPGTSMATPFVAGQAALVRAAAPKLPVRKVAATIDHTARKLAKAHLGFGSVDVMSSLRFAQAHPT